MQGENFLTVRPAADVAAPTIEAVVAPMVHIETLDVEQTLSSIAAVAHAHTRAFITLAKLIVHLQTLQPGVQYYTFLRERGVKPSTIKNASTAVRVWHNTVALGVLDEAQFDELTFAECLTINRSLGNGAMHREQVNLAIERAARDEIDLVDAELGDTKLLVHPRGVRIVGPLTYDEWLSAMTKWQRCKEGWAFGLADLQLYGRIHFGHAEVAEALEKLQFSRADASTARAIELVPEPVRETSTLTAEHFSAIDKAGGEKMSEQDRMRWVATAEKKNLSPTETRRSVTAGRVVRTDPSENGRNSGVHTIEGFAFLLSQWKKKREKEGPILDWPRPSLKALLENLQEAHDLYEQIEAALAQ